MINNIVYLGIGSNINKNDNIKSCINFFKSSFYNCTISPIYESASYGFTGHNFYNLVIKIHTHFDIKSLKIWLMRVEDKHGRNRAQKRYSNRTLDIDILLFNNQIHQDSTIIIPRPEILIQAYVLKPLSDICDELKHPQTGLSLKQHWQQLKVGGISITKVRENIPHIDY